MSNLLKPYNERMMEVLLYIQRNLEGDLSPEKLAGIACFSVAHFHRIFKAMVGENLKEHVRRLRLNKPRTNYLIRIKQSWTLPLMRGSNLRKPSAELLKSILKFLRPNIGQDSGN